MSAMDSAVHSCTARSISRHHSQALQRQEARACSPSSASSLVRSSSLLRSSSISRLSPAHSAKDSRRHSATFGDCFAVASSTREFPAAAKSPRRRSSKHAGPDAGISSAPLSTHAGRSTVGASAAAGEPATCPSPDEPASAAEVQDGVVVRDDLGKLLMCLPAHLREKLLTHPRRSELLEVVLDLGRKPEARFLGNGAGEYLEEREITHEDLEAAQACIGLFGGDNRAGVEGTLHRISCIRNRRGDVVGLTCRVGRAVTGHVDMVRDLLHTSNSLLFLGRPGVGKTTVIREIARVLSDELHKRVVIVDTSNEIGGDGDVPHPAIGGARRMQVPDPALQHRVMVEAVENHMPEVVIVDEIGTEAEALACRTIAERGVMLVGTAHGQLLENLIKNPTLCDLVGGVQTVTLGDEEARSRGTQKSVMERKAPPTFPVLIEMRERHFWVAHQTDKSVDALLHGKRPQVEVRMRDANFKVTTEKRLYDRNGSAVSTGSGGFGRDDFDMTPAIAWSSGSSSNSSGVPLVTITSGRGSREILQELNSLPAQEDKDQTYMWAARLGHVPDKDAMADYVMSASRRSSSSSSSSSSSNWAEFDEEYGMGGGGYMTSGNGGKRGSKRGPRGVRPR